MTIHGKEVDFQVSNIKHAGNMELALKNMEKTEKTIQNMAKEASLSEILQKLIAVFRDFFVEATGVDVLEECQDLEEAKQTYVCFLHEVKKQKETLLAPFSLDQIE